MLKNKPKLNPAIVFAIKFLGLFTFLYGFYIFYLSYTSPGGLYNAFLDKHLNFITGLRYVLIETSSATLRLLGYQTKTNLTHMLVVNHSIINVGYDCLGFGVMTFFAAFVIAYPAVLKSKLYFLFGGLISIQLLNICRFMLLALYWKHSNNYIADHHTIFNIIVYLLITVSIYFYTRYQDKNLKLHAAN